jgi:murein DD-endopeptidase MepM/ murein hydrolase activator NlpD
VIYPTGSKSDYEANWYCAQGFGSVTSYGKHEGRDENLKSGGDSDLGRELVAIAPGKIIYYHYASHPTTGFGRHLVYKIDGPWGTRWIMYAHLDSFEAVVRDVAEGQVIARLGKSGTSSAHLHWSIWKVDPSTNGGIDSIAHNDTELNQKWEDPIAFLNQWVQAPAPIDYKTLYEQSLVTIANQQAQILLLQGQVTQLQSQVNDFNYRISKMKVDIKNYVEGYVI